MYAERPSRIPGAVVWTRPAGRDTVRVLPDGCMDLIWGSDGRAFVAGPDTHAHLYELRGEVALTGIRFPPGLGPSVLGVPASEVRNQRVWLDEVWRPAEVRPLVDRVLAAPEPATALEGLAISRLQADPPRDRARLGEVVRLLRAGWRVADIAFAVNLSERQLHRRSVDAFGYGPKTLARILRLTGAIHAASGGSPLADVAARSGYADQAHLARDVRALAGVPLTTLIAPPTGPVTAPAPDVRFVQDGEALAG